MHFQLVFTDPPVYSHPVSIATISAYPVGNLAAEVIVIIVLALLDVIRIYFGE